MEGWLVVERACGRGASRGVGGERVRKGDIEAAGLNLTKDLLNGVNLGPSMEFSYI